MIKYSKIYRKLAEELASSSNYICIKLGEKSTETEPSSPRFKFVDVFKPSMAEVAEYLVNNSASGYFGWPMAKKAKLERSLALLFMAEIAKDEERVSRKR